MIVEMRARGWGGGVVALLLGACSFVPTGAGPGDGDGGAGDDAAAIDAAVIDAAIDAPVDAAIDARVCPSPPTGCTAFSCAGSTHCYYTCPATNWNNAQARCAGAGGCLVTIDDVGENTCVHDATRPMFPDLVWFGWRQAAGASEPSAGWGWVCGSSPFVAGNWGQFEPNNAGNEDCGAMTAGGAWIDGDCGSSLRSVCELP